MNAKRQRNKVRNEAINKINNMKPNEDAIVYTVEGDPINEKITQKFGRALFFAKDWLDYQVKVTTPDTRQLAEGGDVVVISPDSSAHVLNKVNGVWVEVACKTIEEMRAL
jgi:hypothetical protein